MTSSRRTFLALAGGAALAGCGSGSEGGIRGPGGAGRVGQTPKGDLSIVRFALTLELLESDFYRRARASGRLSSRVRSLFREFGRQEAVHADTLTALNAQLGGGPVKAPRTRFDMGSEREILRQALELENTGAAAYLGQAPRIDDRDVLAAALSIHSVEARHAAAIAELLGEEPLPDGAFAKPLERAQVLEAVEGFVV